MARVFFTPRDNSIKAVPNTVLVLQIVDQPSEDVPVPETDYTFGALIEAQALGDFTALNNGADALFESIWAVIQNADCNV